MENQEGGKPVATIPADDVLAGLNDADLLQMLEDQGIDHSAIDGKEGAIAALKAKRDAAPPAPAPQPEAQTDSKTEEKPPVDEKVAGVDQEALSEVADHSEDADADLSIEEQQAEADRRADQRLPSRFIPIAVRAAVGNPKKHAALLRFEQAYGDFKRAAQELVESGQAGEDNPVANFALMVADS